MVFSSYGKSFNFFLYIFSYNLRNCEEDRDRKDETQKKKKRMRIESIWRWNWDLMQLLAHFDCEMVLMKPTYPARCSGSLKLVWTNRPYKRPILQLPVELCGKTIKNNLCFNADKKLKLFYALWKLFYLVHETHFKLSNSLRCIKKNKNKNKNKKLIFSFEENLHGQITHIMNRCSSAPNDE